LLEIKIIIFLETTNLLKFGKLFFLKKD